MGGGLPWIEAILQSRTSDLGDPIADLLQHEGAPGSLRFTLTSALVRVFKHAAFNEVEALPQPV